MAKNSFNDMIVRAMQKRDASRVALKKIGLRRSYDRRADIFRKR